MATPRQYWTDQSCAKFDGQMMVGSAKIMEKIQSLTFQKITLNTVDCLPTSGGGILINVLGQIDEQRFSQVFVLNHDQEFWRIKEDIFRSFT